MDNLPVALGLDFGTESVRAILVDVKGNQLGIGTNNYRQGQITERLPNCGDQLPQYFALQSATDWLESAASATQAALAAAGDFDVKRIVGIGVDFTSCTMLPTLSDGTPLCNLERFARTPLAWPKLWKHHGAIKQTERMNSIAQARRESFLTRYGGVIGLEWFFPKMLETIEQAAEVADAAEVWLEAGDWLVWQLVGGDAQQLPRSTCQAGYKGLWAPNTGYATEGYLAAVHPQLLDAVRHKLPGRMLSPGQLAGTLQASMAHKFGLPTGIAVSAAIIDAHAAVPGVGAAEAGTLVMVLGTSSCHMLNSLEYRPVEGMAGLVEGGILPGLFGYETGQAAVGDAFSWLIQLLGHSDFNQLTAAARQLPAGGRGVLCLDWMNGCRTPLMNGALKGAFVGLTLNSSPAELYLAMLEGSAFGLKWIVDLFREGNVRIDRLIATGGLPHHNPQLIQIYADVLGWDIEVHPSQHGCAVGAAVLGMLAAGQEKSGFDSVAAAAQAMANPPGTSSKLFSPNKQNTVAYAELYQKYRQLAQAVQAL
jgi:L-ribulokinase